MMKGNNINENWNWLQMIKSKVLHYFKTIKWQEMKKVKTPLKPKELDRYNCEQKVVFIAEHGDAFGRI